MHRTSNHLNLSIVIVTWNCANFIDRFAIELLSSLKSYSRFEILVQDNASNDETVKILRDNNIEVIKSKTNIGFAIANNTLITLCKYRSVLLLNPDVFGFSPAFWSKLFQAWDSVNPLFIRLLNEDGSFQNCVGDVLSLRRYARKIMGGIDFAAINERCTVGMGIMAFMLTSRECLDKVGLLDEGYHMYSEDMDWCYRASRAGYQILYEPKLSLYHMGGGSAAKRWDPLPARLAKIHAERIFVTRHYRGVQRLTLRLILACKVGYHKLQALKLR